MRRGKIKCNVFRKKIDRKKLSKECWKIDTKKREKTERIGVIDLKTIEKLVGN